MGHFESDSSNLWEPLFRIEFLGFSADPVQWFQALLVQPLFTHKATCFKDSGMFS